MPLLHRAYCVRLDIIILFRRYVMSKNPTLRLQAQVRKENLKPYSPFPLLGVVYLRDANGICAKGVYQNNSFTWVDIDPEESPSANLIRQAA
jgi:hypothetical protein